MTALDFIKFLVPYIGKRRNRVIIMSVINGFCMTVLMYSLQLGASQLQKTGTLSHRGLALFLCSLVAYYLTQLFAIRVSSDAAYSAIEDMELRLINKLRRLDYESFKKISAADIYAVLGGDKNAVVNGARFVVITLSALITVGVVMLYLLSVSVTAVILITAEYALMLYVFKVQFAGFEKRNQADYAAMSVFNSSLKDVIDGFAELKMNNRRSEEFYQKRVKASNNNKTEGLKETERRWIRILVIQQANSLFPLGLIVFIAPMLTPMSIVDIAKIVIITLIAVGPASQVGNFISIADLANNTLSRILGIEKQLDDALAGDCEDLSVVPNTPDFSMIKINFLQYHYPPVNNQNGTFTLTVKDFHLDRGELLVIKGGNGSGKSTFMHILAGLFPPVEGDILLNDLAVSSLKSSDYRSLFSIVFSDFHLFDDFYGIDFENTDFNHWVKKLKLEDQVKNYRNQNDRSVDTMTLPTAALSSGQKKRAALLTAILEGRPILLLDEVAADFDPEFRNLYYRELLPELKAMGRTLLIVSHDDRYFDIADRVIEFREGANI
jgi:putative ATP-binding cassette transporter